MGLSPTAGFPLMDDFHLTIHRTLPGNLRDLTRAEEREIAALEGVRDLKFVAIEFNLPPSRILGIWNRPTP